jgi:hypothetical protein
MDYVYICRDGENEELRYSIRSLVENAPEGRIWVIGGKPDWYVGDYIRVPQAGLKYENAKKNLNAICRATTMSDDVVLMNDDFFVMKKIDSVDTFFGGTLISKVRKYKSVYPRSSYTRALSQTHAILSQKAIVDILDYELHVPMPMNRKKLSSVIRINKPFLWRSMYGNMFGVGGTYMQDVKVYGKGSLVRSQDWKDDSQIYLSSMDSAFNGGLLEMLKERFPDPSKYERVPPKLPRRFM